jgi:hypothetical protein
MCFRVCACIYLCVCTVGIACARNMCVFAGVFACARIHVCVFVCVRVCVCVCVVAQVFLQCFTDKHG